MYVNLRFVQCNKYMFQTRQQLFISFLQEARDIQKFIS